MRRWWCLPSLCTCCSASGGQPLSSHPPLGLGYEMPLRYARSMTRNLEPHAALWWWYPPFPCIPQMHTPARSSQCWSRQTPAWTRIVHLDAPGQRHGQQPISGTADPRSSQTGQVLRGLRRHNQNTFGPTEGQNEQWREASRRRQRQTIRYRSLVPTPPPLCLGTALCKNRPLLPRPNSRTTFFTTELGFLWFWWTKDSYSRVQDNRTIICICTVCGIWKHFNVPEPKPKPKPKPAPQPKAAPPKGQHRQVFRIVYHRKKVFTSEPVEH